MSVVSDEYLKTTLLALRSGSEDLGLIRLKLALDGVFDSACDDLKDVVVGRMVNKGVDADEAREAATAIEEYAARVKGR